MTETEEAEATDSDPVSLARRVIRQNLTTVLSTLDRSGHPFGTLVLSATDYDISPLFLMSTLATHTRNVKRDPHVSVLFDATRALDVPMSGARVTVSGILERVENESCRQRFLRRHKDAALYADFADFGFFRLVVSQAWLVAGFGRTNKISPRQLLTPCSFVDDLAAREADIVSHMNDEHSATLDDMARSCCDADQTGWTMTGLDAEGLDLRLGGDALRIDFPKPLPNIEQVRAFLVDLAKTSRI
jgi:heme iron utilization protein